MVKLESHEALFSALANRTRRSILDTLRSGPRAISDLAGPFDMSLVAVSKHVHVLEDAGLVRIRREGRSRLCHLDPEPFRDGLRWMARFASFWQDELDQVERWLEGAPTSPEEATTDHPAAAGPGAGDHPASE